MDDWLTNQKIFEVLKDARNHFLTNEETKKVTRVFSYALPFDLREKYFSISFQRKKDLYIKLIEGEIESSNYKEEGAVSYNTFISSITKPSLQGGAFGKDFSFIKPKTKRGFFSVIEKCRNESLRDATSNFGSMVAKASNLKGKNALRKYEYLDPIEDIIKKEDYSKKLLDYDLKEIENFSRNLWKKLKKILGDRDWEIEISYDGDEKILVTSEGTEIIYPALNIMSIYLKGKIETKIGEITIEEKIREKSLEDIIKKNMIEKAINNLKRKIKNTKKAVDISPGIYDVIFVGSSYADAVHEAGAAHLFSLKYFSENRMGAYSLEEIGKKIGNENLTVILDPLYTGKGEWGYYEIDDEGVKAKKIVLIENGFLKNFITDRKSTSKLRVVENKYFPLCGHGRREGIEKDVEPRVSNLIIRWNKKLKSKEEIIKKFIQLLENKGRKYGLLFSSFSGEVEFWEEDSERNEEGEERKTICSLYPDELYLLNINEEIIPVYPNISINFTPRFILENIVDAGGKYIGRNHYCGSESGLIPVYSESPSYVIVENMSLEKSKIENVRGI